MPENENELWRFRDRKSTFMKSPIRKMSRKKRQKDRENWRDGTSIRRQLHPARLRQLRRAPVRLEALKL